MLDEFKEEEIVNKVGGRFKLSSLIQKRLVALNRGARPLVELNSGNNLEIVVAEIMQDKIYLDTSGRLAVRAGDQPDAGLGEADAGPTLEDLVGD
jgi:DNA-directed RNA polymerase subunit omega